MSSNTFAINSTGAKDKNTFSLVKRDQVYHDLQTTRRQKIPRYSNLSIVNGLNGEPGYEGDLILNRDDRRFYGHNGVKWMQFIAGEDITIESAGDLCSPVGESIIVDGVGPSFVLKGVSGDSSVSVTDTGNCLQLAATGLFPSDVVIDGTLTINGCEINTDCVDFYFVTPASPSNPNLQHLYLPFTTYDNTLQSLTVGDSNTVSSDHSSAIGGQNNTASGNESSVIGGDNNTASGTDSSVIGGILNIASGYESSVMGGNVNTASQTASSVIGGLTNNASGVISSVIGGQNNIAAGLASSVMGGVLNTTAGQSSSVIGGQSNTATALYSAIIGGTLNSTAGQSSMVIGGESNTATALYSAIIGGTINSTAGQASTVIGGQSNTASGNESSVIGGNTNTALGNDSSVIGGNTNTASGYESSVIGGNVNTASQTASSVIGGLTNNASGVISSVIGGQNNIAAGLASSVMGGVLNTAAGQSSSVIGGQSNTATALYSALIGGTSNFAEGQSSMVIGGEANTSSGNASVVLGGANNTAFGHTSVVLGGTNNTATGTNSIASGDTAVANFQGTIAHCPLGPRNPVWIGDRTTYSFYAGLSHSAQTGFNDVTFGTGSTTGTVGNSITIPTVAGLTTTVYCRARGSANAGFSSGQRSIAWDSPFIVEISPAGVYSIAWNPLVYDIAYNTDPVVTRTDVIPTTTGGGVAFAILLSLGGSDNWTGIVLFSEITCYTVMRS